MIPDWSATSIQEAIGVSISTNTEMVDRWMRGERGSWGALAGKAVIDCRDQLGRSLTEEERGEVWVLLWRQLVAMKKAQDNRQN